MTHATQSITQHPRYPIREQISSLILHLLLRSEPFNESNLEHEMSLLQLWTLLQPDTPLHKRVTKQWQTIGELLRCVMKLST